MRERPILFNGPMVRAIIEGRKTVTRRLVKPQPGNLFVSFGELQQDPAAGFGFHDGETFWKSPYGQPGDRLWVRESWARIRVAQAPDQEWVVYRENDNRTDYGGPWKPSIHMRRRDSRILLEIIDVRVERLQEITEKQAAAEGIPPSSLTPSRLPEFRDLWASSGGDWESNPWVWVVEFKSVPPI